MASHRRWLRKPENESYFHGPEHLDRVQRWRRDHPGYWRRKSAPARLALQDLIDTQALEPMGQNGRIDAALQDVMAQRPRRTLERSPLGGQRGDQSFSAGSGPVQGTSP